MNLIPRECQHFIQHSPAILSASNVEHSCQFSVVLNAEDP